MTDRMKLLENGLQNCEALLVRYPLSMALQSVKKQINYLLELEQGKITDRTLLKDITIGVLTAREVESLDNDAAEVFYKIASLSKQM